MFEPDPVVDSNFMDRCLWLAKQADGRTAPNPIVGAVVLDSRGTVVGEGYHQKAGGAHAEVFAFDQALHKAKNGTLYVNLEPCCHHGRTPPCVERVIASGVRRVVVGMQDPNPKVEGGGIAALRAAGITVDVGVLEDECRFANRGFISRITRGRPWVLLKMACTLDGRIADRDGNSRWISGSEAQVRVHQLRDRFDCVLIGAQTARHDDPELTVRGLNSARNPARAVVDPGLTIKPSARIYRDLQDGSRVFVFGLPEAIQSRGSEFSSNVILVAVDSAEQEIDLHAVLRSLAQYEINSVLCEGGGRLAGSLLEQRLVDEVQWIIAPKLLVDQAAIPAVATPRKVPLSEAVTLDRVSFEKVGDDLIVSAIVKT